MRLLAFELDRFLARFATGLITIAVCTLFVLVTSAQWSTQPSHAAAETAILAILLMTALPLLIARTTVPSVGLAQSLVRRLLQHILAEQQSPGSLVERPAIQRALHLRTLDIVTGTYSPLRGGLAPIHAWTLAAHAILFFLVRIPFPLLTLTDAGIPARSVVITRLFVPPRADAPPVRGLAFTLSRRAPVVVVVVVVAADHFTHSFAEWEG